ncbi:MAG: hypothetical protein JKP98_21275 [Rhodobacteraceae bacterium]|nr:hypothetical protein [Paracoccaceae bacterium]
MTLIEAVLFISIALAVIVGGLVFYQQAAIASQTQATIRLAQALVAETRSRFRPDDAKIDNLDEVMVKAGAVPGNAVLDGTDGCWVQSQWGGCIAFKSSFIKSSGERYMEMKLYGIRPAVCARIVPFDEAGNGVLGAAEPMPRCTASRAVNWSTASTVGTALPGGVNAREGRRAMLLCGRNRRRLCCRDLALEQLDAAARAKMAR